MKKVQLILFFSLIARCAEAQPASFYINTIANVSTMRFTSDAIYIHTGTSKLIKTDYSGNVIWTRNANASKWTVDESSIYIITSQNKLIKVDSSGNLLWARDISAPFCNWATWNGVAGLVSKQDVIYIITSSNFTGSGEALVAIDSSGSYLNSWCDYSGDAVLINNSFPSLSGGVWIGYVLSPGNVSEYALTKTDHVGNIDSSVTNPYFSISPQCHVLDVIPLADSTYMAIDHGSDVDLISLDRCGLTKFREDGTTIWEKVFVGFDTAYAPAYAGTDNFNNTYLVLYGFEIITYTSFYVALKVDSSGQVLFCKKWNSFPSNIQFNDDYQRMHYNNGNFYCPVTYMNGPNKFPAVFTFDSLMNASCFITDSAIGITQVPPFPGSTGLRSSTNTSLAPVITTVTYTTAVNPINLDLCIAVGIQSETSPRQTDILLSPNPFSSNLTLHFSNLQHLTALLKIFNSIGEAVVEKEIRLEDQTLNLEELPQGIYIVRVRTEKEVWTQKIIKN